MEIGIDPEITNFFLRGSLERDCETVNIAILIAVNFLWEAIATSGMYSNK
jgi:hypothetical protein